MFRERREEIFYSILFYSILFYSILFYSILFYSIYLMSNEKREEEIFDILMRREKKKYSILFILI
jgi:hypothetical protein